MTRALIIVWAAILAVAAVPAAAQSTDPTDILGRIELSGCAPAPQQIQIKALPASGVPVGPDGTTPAAMGVGVARVLARDADGGYPFTITGLEARKAYRLSVKLQDKQCGTLRWQGPSLVLPGQSPVRIGGLAIRTQIEILGEASDGGSRQWLGARIVNVLDSVAASSRIRLYSDNPAVKSFVLQFSDRAFPTIPRAIESGCLAEEDQNLLGERIISATGPGWTEATINFNEVLFPALGIQSAAGVATAAGVTSTSQVTEFAMGAPIYVRAVAELDDHQRLCDPATSGVGGWIIVSTGGLSANPGLGIGGTSTLHVDAANYAAPKVHAYPSSGEACFRAVADHTIGQYGDPVMAIDIGFDWFVKAGTSYRDGHTFLKGDAFCIPGAGAVDEAVGTGITLVSGAIDAFGFMVTSIAQVWNQIKGAVAGVLVDVISFVGIPCDGKCAAAIEMGINAGLAAMGLPPSLPNWDELKSQGLDYLAGQIANQAGLPPDVVAAAMDYAVAAIEELERTRGGDGRSLPRWVQPDLGFEPGYLTFELRQEGSAGALEPMRTLTVADNAALLGGIAPIPPLGGKTLQLPMVLRPNLAGLPPRPFSEGITAPGADALWAKIMWAGRFVGNPCVGFQVQVAEQPLVGEPTIGTFMLASRLFVGGFFEGPLLPGYTYDKCAR